MKPAKSKATARKAKAAPTPVHRPQRPKAAPSAEKPETPLLAPVSGLQSPIPSHDAAFDPATAAETEDQKAARDQASLEARFRAILAKGGDKLRERARSFDAEFLHQNTTLLDFQKRAKFGGKDGGGREVEEIVSDFLEAHHAGFCLPAPIWFKQGDNSAKWKHEQTPLLTNLVVATVKGDYTYIRKIADAVKVIHDDRAKGKGAEFEIEPVDEIRAKAFAHVERYGPPETLEDTKIIMFAAGFKEFVNGKKVDPKIFRDWHKELAGKPAPRGAPRGPRKPPSAPAPIKTPGISAKEIHRRAVAASAKLPPLLAKKSPWQKGGKARAT